MTPLATFCRQLIETGEAVTSQQLWDQPTGAESLHDSLRPAIERYELTLPVGAPQVSSDALLFGARVLCWSACMLLDRDAGDVALPNEIACTRPDSGCVEDIYSVDVLLRFLPSIQRRAQNASEQDPLLQSLQQIGRDWPLSCPAAFERIEPAPATDSKSAASTAVEFEQVANPAASRAILNSVCLRLMLIDRICAAGLLSEKLNSGLRQLIETQAGAHPEFLTNFAKDLQQ